MRKPSFRRGSSYVKTGLFACPIWNIDPSTVEFYDVGGDWY
jgi:hypothetical protein